VTAPLSGNLTVFPGSHLVLQEVIREAGGPEALFNLDLGGTTDLQAASVSRLRALAAPRMKNQAQQLCMQEGDIVLAHYQLAHNIAPNCSPDIRYMVYFRLHHRAHMPQSCRPETLTNVWLDYAGVQKVLGERPAVFVDERTRAREALANARALHKRGAPLAATTKAYESVVRTFIDLSMREEAMKALDEIEGIRKAAGGGGGASSSSSSSPSSSSSSSSSSSLSGASSYPGVF